MTRYTPGQATSIVPLIDEAFALHCAGRLDEAEALYCEALHMDPGHRGVRKNLAQVLIRGGRFEDAVALLTERPDEWQEDVSVHGQLGLAYAGLNRLELSLDHFQRVLAQSPDDTSALQFVANLQQALGQKPQAHEHYRRGLALKPFVTIEAIKSPPAFRVLMLFAPGAGNTPFEHLVERVGYETHVLNLLPDVAYDIDMLRDSADVVVNLVADGDQGHALLAPATKLVDLIGKPVVNHPGKIARTSRDSIARRLTAIAGCHVPQTLRVSGKSARGSECDPKLASFSRPWLIRLAGTHNGDDFQKVHDENEIDAFVTRFPDADFYLTEYCDYRSADGYFRKYRFMFIDGEIYPYHLAIHDEWKIHHANTDMVNQHWMQDEEKAFLDDPRSVFGPPQFDALRAIQQEIDLDYFGIDCALDLSGRIVVFEVNACMLVHSNNAHFSYKNNSVSLIKDGFEAMLRRMASGH
ncbi:Tetratricopeptide repeat protein [Caballeronia sp. SBC1]|uniref:tetratricopeptide repeat protein n=1 Tax=unclassified Caballeronia TaxID=2646786 RepID=UPI0013E13B71|nr:MULTISPECIES: tetratricopeptide repeat protein [unclassified Caballeronia]QIE23874.1 Tetratricopeptide repeat protein [Caballeronia sp. SBC2]QIN61770.1 Tetratricopeptide repeat protein [Caballeronia sp. SBC1]